MGKRQKRTYSKYTLAYKLEALKMIETGQSLKEVSKKLEIGESLLHKWRYEQKVKPSEVSSTSVAAMTEKEYEKQIRELSQEVEILKKALLIFSRKT
jgi:transposase